MMAFLLSLHFARVTIAIGLDATRREDARIWNR